MKIQIGRNGKTIPTDDSWQFGIGNDHACQMLRADVCEHVKLAHDELGIRYIRFHGIFDDDLLVIQRLTDYFNFAAMPWAGKVQELSFRQIANVFDNVLKCGIPVTDHIQDILVDRPGKVDPRLGVVDPPQHPYTICIVRQKHRHSSSCTHTAVQQRTSGSFTV